MEKQARIYVCGADTIIGAAIVRQLRRQGYQLAAAEADPDPTDACEVEDFFSRTAPEFVFLAGGKSGGIGANQKYPATLMRDNLLIATHVIHCAYRYGVKRLLYLASSCCYPRLCPQPMRVESLLTGPVEPTNEAYAGAKLAGIQLCQAYRREYGVDFIVALPANAFGPGDDFTLEDSHVIAALVRKMHEAKVSGAPSVEIWGTGAPRREFIYVDDLADACLFIMREYREERPINVGVGSDLSIRELAELIREVVGFRGDLYFNSARPDGMPAKLLDSSPLKTMGWRPKTSMQTALQVTYRWFLEEEQKKGTGGVRAVL